VSITSPIPDPGSGIAFTAVGQVCFYCGRPTSDPAIHWSGFDADIYLHRECVYPLFVRLGRDEHEAACPEYYRQLRDGQR
jgi:hypothetical protein